MMLNRFGGFEITKYQVSDFESIAKVFKNSYIQTYPKFDKQFHKTERFEEILSKNTLLHSQVWTAKYQNKIIGFLALAENHIDQLYIDADFQRRGLGSFWVAQAKTIYPDFLELYTLDCNKQAITFYKKHSFKITQRSVAPDEQMPDIKMRWER